MLSVAKHLYQPCTSQPPRKLWLVARQKEILRSAQNDHLSGAAAAAQGRGGERFDGLQTAWTNVYDFARLRSNLRPSGGASSRGCPGFGRLTAQQSWGMIPVIGFAGGMTERVHSCRAGGGAMGRHRSRESRGRVWSMAVLAEGLIALSLLVAFTLTVASPPDPPEAYPDLDIDSDNNNVWPATLAPPSPSTSSPPPPSPSPTASPPSPSTASSATPSPTTCREARSPRGGRILMSWRSTSTMFSTRRPSRWTGRTTGLAPSGARAAVV